MRIAVVAVLVSSTALAQAEDAPRRLQLELHVLREEREEVSVALPVTFAAVGLGLFLTGAGFDAATSSARPRGGVSVLGAVCYLASSFLMLPGLSVLLSRWLEKSMLAGHIRDVEVELAYAQ